jgi:hypothetical protein
MVLERHGFIHETGSSLRPVPGTLAEPGSYPTLIAVSGAWKAIL